MECISNSGQYLHTPFPDGSTIIVLAYYKCLRLSLIELVMKYNLKSNTL